MKSLTRQPGRKLMVMLLASSMAGLPLASEARLGGGSSGRSMSVTRSAPMASSSSSRLGSGGSAGMTRPDVMARARSNSAAPAGAYAGGAPMSPAAPAAAAPRSGPGWGTVAGAAAVGAAAGYMLGDHNSPQTQGNVGQNNGGLGNSEAGASRDMQRSAADAGAPLPQEKPSGGFGFGSLLGLLALGGAGLWAFRKYQAGQRPQFASRNEPVSSFKVSDAPVFGASAPAAGNADAAMEQLALKAFNELQDANNRGDLAFLRTRVDDLLFQQLEADITQRGGPGHTTVVAMRPLLLDISDQGSRRLVSIQYTGTIVEGPNAAPEALDEVWHFVDESRGFWKLAGIEQV
jgi:predicted lipid-binding transport protein (Tim44 family)